MGFAEFVKMLEQQKKQTEELIKATQEKQLSEVTKNVPSDSAANICKSNGNLQKFQGELGDCRTGADTDRIKTFFSKLDDVQGFFESQFAQFNDLMATGDKFHGSSANSTVLTEVNQRNKDLQTTLETLQKDTKRLRASTERHERDFLDVKGALPERIPTQRMNVLDDYTMLLLTISYIMMALSIVFYYAQKNEYTMSSILLGTIGMAVITCIAYVLTLIIL